MAIKKQKKKVTKKSLKKSTTHKKSASSAKGKKSKKKALSKSSKKSATKKEQKHRTPKEKSLKGTGKNPKLSKQKKSGSKITSNQSRSVLGKIQKQMVTFKKKVQDSLVISPSLKKKSATAKTQSTKKTTQKKVTKKSQKPTTSPLSIKSSQAMSTESINIQTKPPVPLQSTGQNAVRTTIQKKSSATNKLDMAKKELAAILEREKEEKLILKDMEGRNYCCVEDCGFSAEVEGYCRLHYLGHWDYIIKRNKILKNEILEKIINQLISDHSQNILNYLLQDLKQDKTFTSTIKTLLEEDEDIEFEDTLLS